MILLLGTCPARTRDPYLTFNRRIIFVHEVALNQLNSQARFSDTTTSDNDQLILSQELGRMDRVSHWNVLS